MRVVIQGEEGSNSSVAARQLLGAQIDFVFCASFDEAFAALDAAVGECVAVLPLHNSTAGEVPQVAARLKREPRLTVKSETHVSIRFVAAALPGAAVTRILAHPMAAKQCGRFLSRVGWQVVEAHDTAGAARLVREGGDLNVAALCPQAAADAYGLAVVHGACGDDANAVTRFILVAHA